MCALCAIDVVEKQLERSRQRLFTFYEFGKDQLPRLKLGTGSHSCPSPTSDNVNTDFMNLPFTIEENTSAVEFNPRGLRALKECVLSICMSIRIQASY